MRASARSLDALEAVAAALEQAGASLTLCSVGRDPVAIGPRPAAARVVFRTEAALRHLLRREPLALAEAYLEGQIELDGDMPEILKASELFDLEPSGLEKLRRAGWLALRGRRKASRDAIAFHYDRPVEFFLPWLDRWRSYSHGFYASAEEEIADAQARKLQHAIDALGLRPGMRVFEMGGGWGSFVEYAGLRGIEVHSITLSREQQRFVSELIRERELPCRVERVDFLDYRPDGRFDAAVFMGTLEHFSDYRRVAGFLSEHLVPEGRFYADFCAQRESFEAGAFIRKHLWPGAAGYVNVPALLDALIRAGWNVHELADDTLSYAFTVRDWACRLEAVRKELAAEFGEPAVRAFLLFLWGSFHFLSQNKTQAYHLVAARSPAALRG